MPPPVNYLLQHGFVFRSRRHHTTALRRCVGATLRTLPLNTAAFWLLANQIGIVSVASQILTIGFIVPVNFMLNRAFTFAQPAREGS